MDVKEYNHQYYVAHKEEIMKKRRSKNQISYEHRKEYLRSYMREYMRKYRKKKKLKP